MPILASRRGLHHTAHLLTIPSSGRYGDLAYGTHYLSCCDPEQPELPTRLPNDRVNYTVRSCLVLTHVLYDPQKYEVVMYKVVKLTTTRTCHVQSGFNYNSYAILTAERTEEPGTNGLNYNRFCRRACLSTSPICLTD